MVITAKQSVSGQLPSSMIGVFLKISVGLCFVLVATSCSRHGETELNNTNANHLERASRYEAQGQFRAAAIEYRNAIQKSADKDEAKLRLASLLNHLGQSKSALNVLEQVEDKSSDTYQLALIKTYVLRDKYKSAQQALQQFGGLASSAPNRYNLLRAQIYEGLGQTEQALGLYQSLVEGDPTLEEAVVGMAKMLLKSGDKPAALEAIAEAKTHIPKSVNLLLLEAGIAYGSGELDNAEVALNQALSELPAMDVMSPQKVRVLSMLVDVLARQGRSTEAYVYTKLLAEEFPGAAEIKSRFESAMAAFKQGDWIVAEEQLSAILSEVPTHEAAGSLLAVVKYMQGDIASADQLFQDYTDSETIDGSMKRVYALTNMRMNRPEQVMSLFEDDLEKGDNPTSLGLYGAAALASNNTVIGVEALKKSLKLDPSQTKFRLLLANHFNSIALPQEALDILKQGLTLPYDGQLDLAYVRQLITMKQYKQAESFITGRLSEKSDNNDHQLLAGEFYLVSGQPQKAKNYFTAVVNRDKTNLRAHRGLLRIDVASESWDKVLTRLEDIIALNEYAEFAYRGIIITNNRLGRIQVGVDRVAALAKEKPDNPIPRGVLSHYYLSEGQLDLAEKQWRQIVDSESGLNVKNRLGTEIQLVKARRALNKESYDEARAALLSILQSGSDNSTALFLLVNTEIRAGRFKEAEKVIGQIPARKALTPLINELKADLALAQNQLADALDGYMEAWTERPVDSVGVKINGLIKQLQTSAAAQTFIKEDWLRKLPQSVPARLVLADALQRDNQLKAAGEVYEEVVALTSTSVVALNNLAWIYQQMGDKRAIATAKQAYELSPESPEVIDTYGWILVQNQQYQEGKPLLDKALKLSPDNKEIQRHVQEADKLMGKGV